MFDEKDYRILLNLLITRIAIRKQIFKESKNINDIPQECKDEATRMINMKEKIEKYLQEESE